MRGVPSATWMMPHFVKPFFSKMCCMILLSAWVSARRLSQCSKHQLMMSDATPGRLPAEAKR